LNPSSGDLQMSKKQTITKKDYEPLQFVRWVLFLVFAAEAAGIENINRTRLHSLLFLSFASAPFYGIKPLRQRAQKTSQGPYYRAAHFALGTLVLSGLIDIAAFSSHVSGKDLQFEGVFKPTIDGQKVVHQLRQTHTGALLYKFLLDLCLGTASAFPNLQPDTQTEEELDKILENDLTYQQAANRAGQSLIIEENVGEITPTVKGLRMIDSHLRKNKNINARDVIGAYQSLLKRRIA
jgi:hypothetical protein